MDKDTVFIFIITLACFFGIFFSVGWRVIKERQRQQAQLDSEYEIEIQKARLIAKESGISYSGSVKMPQHNICYKAVFALDDGRTLTFNVDEEIYNALYEGQTGNLKFFEDYFHGFEALEE